MAAHAFPGAAGFSIPEPRQVPPRFPAQPPGQGRNGGQGADLWGALSAAAPNQCLPPHLTAGNQFGLVRKGNPDQKTFLYLRQVKLQPWDLGHLKPEAYTCRRWHPYLDPHKYRPRANRGVNPASLNPSSPSPAPTGLSG